MQEFTSSDTLSPGSTAVVTPSGPSPENAAMLISIQDRLSAIISDAEKGRSRQRHN